MEIDVTSEFRDLIAAARKLSADVGETVAEILRTGLDRPLPREEARALLTRVVTVMRERAVGRGDDDTVALLDRDMQSIIDRALFERDRIGIVHRPKRAGQRPHLQDYNGIQPHAVRPSPVFHEHEVAVMEGFVRARDIQLWDENERIDIHLKQFERTHGRRPSSDELLDIMLGHMSLPGLNVRDQFEIKELARSIAVNGVRKPPILDLDGVLLDGNRRVAACQLILNSDEFDAAEKRRAEWLQVWQLTEHATQTDREAVIVSLNFEPDYKQDWPEYVKARKVHAEWQAMLVLEPRANSVRQRELKKQLSKKFALGPDSAHVNRYIQMVELADEFEDYHVRDRNRDRYEVKHRAERFFQYFDELGKGKGAGGVHYALNQDDTFKHLVYDLLFEGKFRNWNRIRDLKYVANNEEALAFLRDARDISDIDRAQDLVDDGCSAARMIRSVERTIGGNKRIEVFVDWLENAPVRIFRPGAPDSVKPENLNRLYGALKLIEGYVTPEPAR
jgi:hypothetical protein